MSSNVADKRIVDVMFDADVMTWHLRDGRRISVPLEWYPRLFEANDRQRLHWALCCGGLGVTWAYLDEDLHVDGLLDGRPSPEFFVDPEQSQAGPRR